MGFWERVLHYDDPGISAHWVLGFLAEIARGRATRAQAVAALQLNASEEAEIALLADTVTSLPAGVQKLARAKEIEDVLLLGESRFAPYDSVAAVKPRLGV